ncbi:ABC transporter permease [Listeria booriae]|uniref:ABC transporter permease n=1 Tax=Listeria booriae TaxID=1552123 RepID=UPI001624E2A7|nr:ABC transporter permease [Listeria booriae]MBC2149766.1 ABC transporter permease subunit [Listeria booriae]
MVKNILKSEWVKFFSSSWCIWGTIFSILIAPLILSLSGNSQSLMTHEVLSASLRNLFLSQIGLVIVSASFWGQEYSHSYLRTTLLAVPSRTKLILSKMILLVFVVWTVGIVSSLICLGIGAIQYDSILTLHVILKFMSNVTIAMLSWTFITCITVALTIIFKSQIIPISIMFSLIIGLSQVLMSITKTAKYLPDLATMNLFFTTDVPTLLSGYEGLLIQFIWVLVLFLISFGLIQYRDVR